MAPRAGLPEDSNSNVLDWQTGPKGDTESKELSGAVANPATLPLVLAEWPRNSHEIVRVALDEYHGRTTIDVRVWYRDRRGALCPARSGITLAVKHLPALAEAIAKASRQALELGLLNGGA